MYVSHETAEQTERRLLQVIAQSHLQVYSATYTFSEVPENTFPTHLVSSALAFVKDSQVWSALIPSNDDAVELFTIFSFHFKDGLDNSGFVGWLASHLKRAVGTGVFVVCGQNSKLGGIFDYWGAPLSVGAQVIAEVERMRSSAGNV